MKSHLNSAQGSLDKRKSIWRKRFLIFLTGILVEEEEQKIYDDNSKTRFEIATLLVQQRCARPLDGVVLLEKHPPEAKSFWENFELERQLAIKEDIFDKKSQIDALNVLDASRSQKSNEYIGKVNSRAESADTSSGQKRKKKIYPSRKRINNRSTRLFQKSFCYFTKS
ncbi:hypothetical protein C1645_742413 [Glomus cerebriforme]|uniref:Uncharacterized protein n=1 Tax=Glomus cerebriforme TaxID=658196 RepID=A0A397SI48_9GLOM|nr:hypothetical protein C1645_742413 [Glomus cerebriforme]